MKRSLQNQSKLVSKQLTTKEMGSRGVLNLPGFRHRQQLLELSRREKALTECQAGLQKLLRAHLV